MYCFLQHIVCLAGINFLALLLTVKGLSGELVVLSHHFSIFGEDFGEMLISEMWRFSNLAHELNDTMNVRCEYELKMLQQKALSSLIEI